MTSSKSLRSEPIDDHAAMLAASDLLLEVRSRDPLAGLWEPGDVQWWYATEPKLAAVSRSLWHDTTGTPIAVTLEAVFADEPGQLPRVDVDILGDLEPGGAARRLVLPVVLDQLADPRFHPDAIVAMNVDGRDADLADRLEKIGFVEAPHDRLDAMGQRADPAAVVPALPAGYRFADGTEPAAGPHHLVARNGPEVHDRLLRCPLHRPEFDLRIVAPDGTAAAYCLLWRDGATGVGHFEPVRTEGAHQRRGLGRALMAEGMRRLAAHGATLVKVDTYANNPAAIALYTRAGFQRYGVKRSLHRPPVVTDGDVPRPFLIPLDRHSS